MGDPLLEVRDLRVRLGGKDIVKRASFSIERGEVTLITGPSGSGKTTLLRALSGIIPKVIKGEVHLRSRPELSRVIPSVMYIHQEPWFSVVTPYVWSEVTSFARTNLGWEDLREVLSRYGLSGLEERATYTLSAGELQRLSVATAEVSGKEVVLLDEPTSHLDRNNALRVVEAVKRFKESGRSVAVVDHRVDLWMGIAEKVYVMKGGELLQEGIEYLREVVGPYSNLKTALARSSDTQVGDVVVTVKSQGVKLPGGREILCCFSFDVRRGEVVWVKGRSGIGKTTLLRAISRGGLGGIKVKLKGRVLYVPDNPLLYFTEPTPLREVLGRVDLLTSLGLKSAINTPLLRLSVGERRRVAVASLIARGTDVALIDEPTVGLDFESKLKVLKSIRWLADRGVAVIISSHDPDLSLVADEVVDLDNLTT